MAVDRIETAYRSAWWALLLRGLLGLALGAFIFLRPLESVASFALVIAFWALFSGIAQIVHAFELRRVFARWWVLLLSGLVSALFGVAALDYYPGLSLTFAVVWTTWWLFLTGIIAVYIAITERRLALPWGWTLTSGIVSIVAALFALMNPPATLAAIMGLIAGFAVVSGVVLLVGAFKLSSTKSEITAAMGSASRV